MNTGARTRGRRNEIGRSELALAYELKQEGVEHIVVAYAMGCNPSYLYTLLARCEREGLAWNPKP